MDEQEKLPNSEQKKWESDKFSSAMYKFGSKDATRKQQEEYELLLEDQIEFIQAMTIKDEKKEKSSQHIEPKISDQQRRRMNIRETKESLPVFPFKDDLIDSIRANQVSISILIDMKLI